MEGLTLITNETETEKNKQRQKEFEDNSLDSEEIPYMIPLIFGEVKIDIDDFKLNVAKSSEIIPQEHFIEEQRQTNK